jgi:succinate-acetate transporter protein
MDSSNRTAEQERSIVRVVVHPYATALPLGCFAFGIGNALLAAFTAHWIPPSDAKTVAIMMLAFVAPLELIPCLMAFLARDTGTVTAMGIFAGGWVVQGLELLMAGPASLSPTIGLFLNLLALCLALLAVATFSGKPLIGSLFCVAALRSSGAGFLQFGVTGPLAIMTAILGLAVAAMAFYSGIGFLLEDVEQKPMAMMFRSGKAKEALNASLHDQLENVAREAGVRPQL